MTYGIWLRNIGLGLVTALVLAAVWVASCLPQTTGEAGLPGLSGEVRVYRDGHGVPHIFAGSMNDALAALGYLHASDRLFQMEATRRAASGTLSEMFGDGLLNYDRKMRLLNFAGLAEENFKALSPPVQEALQHYADGVNAYLKNHRGSWPPEFTLLGVQPAEWKPSDGLLWGKLMAWQLSADLGTEVFRGGLLKQGWSRGQIEALAPGLDLDAPVTTVPLGWADNHGSKVALGNAGRVTQAGDQPIQKFFEGLPNSASNIFAVAGARTESGKPVLANDPHLQLQSPVLWYLARIVTPELEIKGASVAGMPFFPLGQNKQVAWGFTTSSLDVQDLVFVKEAAAKIDTRKVQIKVKGGASQEFTARSVDGMPVISDVMAEANDIAPEGTIGVLNYTGLRGDDRTAEALWLINKASSVADIRNATKLYRAPPQNMMAADTHNQIAFFSVGAMPQRGEHAADGAWPRISDNPHAWVSEWQAGPVLQLTNPAEGVLLNANNALVDTARCQGFCPATHNGAEPYRAMRLEELLKDSHGVTASAAATVMLDVRSMAAKLLLPKMLAAAPPDDQAFIAGLKRWDGAMRAEDWQPLFFNMWLQKLTAKLFGAEALPQTEWPRAWAVQHSMDKANPEVIAESFRDARQELEKIYGLEFQKWRWGAAHVAALKHPLWSKVPGLGDMWSLAIETDGDNTTLNRAGPVEYDGMQSFADEHGAGYRAAYDVGDPDKSLFIIAGGQSGVPFAKHYGDMVGAWASGKYIQMRGDEAALKKDGATMLRLTP